MGATAAARTVTAAPLTPEGFAEFGSVIDASAVTGRPVNAGTALAFGPLAELDLTAEGGIPAISIFRVQPTVLPHACDRLERHPLSSQAFMPLAGAPFLIVVAPATHAGAAPDPAELCAFLSNGRQGVSYGRGVWHHALIALEREGDFLMIGRSGSGNDLERAQFDGGMVVTVDLASSLPQSHQARE